MSVKFHFNSDAVMKKARNIAETTIQKNPSRFLSGHEGETHSGRCPKCGNRTAKILKDGFAQCPKCGYTTKATFNIRWS